MKLGHLLQNVALDPNDPRNVDLLDYVRTQQVIHFPHASARIFRLGSPRETSLTAITRASQKRAKFLKDRWEALGAIKGGWCSKTKLKSAVTPLSVRNILNEEAYAGGLSALQSLSKPRGGDESEKDASILRMGKNIGLIQGMIPQVDMGCFQKLACGSFKVLGPHF